MTWKNYSNNSGFQVKSPEAVFLRHPQWAGVQLLLSQLRGEGYTAYLAGGCVRDGLLGRPPKDFDIATNARPEAVARLFPQSIMVGAQFGVVMAPMEGYQVEVTTFRSEGPYLDARHPEEIVFSSPREDAERRDFTVNALFYDPEKCKVIDYVNGIEDLKNNLLRTVGSATERFQEDALRTLRAVRFSAELGFSIEKKTYLAIKKQGNLLGKISRERILQEWRRLCEGPFCFKGWSVLLLSNLESYIFPQAWQGLFQNPLLWSKVKWRVALLEGHSEPLQVWLESLTLGLKEAKLVSEDSMTTGWRELTLPNDNLNLLSRISKCWHQLVKGEARMGQVLEWLGAEGGERLLEYWRSELLWDEDSLQPIENALQQYKKISDSKGVLPPPLVTGENLKKWGEEPGPKMGKWLQELRWQQLEGEITSIEQAKKMWLTQNNQFEG